MKTNAKQPEHNVEERSYFTFFSSFREQIDLCEEEEQLKLYRAITDFALLHKDTEFDVPILQIAWIGIKPILENGWEKHNHGTLSKGVLKPSLKGNKNAVKRSRNEAETKQKQNNSIEKESIEKESIEKDSIGGTGDTPPEAPTLSDEEIKFNEWMKGTFPRVSKMDEPLTLEQYKKLEAAHGRESVTRILQAMNNNKHLARNDSSAYVTCLDRMQRNIKQNR